ncbi:MAG: hypothetical protein KDK41_08300 [Leptospiraceae bacterium]|nr:hypothetical protein [Leptospiraceae bacterium]
MGLLTRSRDIVEAPSESEQVPNRGLLSRSRAIRDQAEQASIEPATEVKKSLRERALDFLRRLGSGGKPSQEEYKPKGRSLLQRAKELLEKLRGVDSETEDDTQLLEELPSDAEDSLLMAEVPELVESTEESSTESETDEDEEDYIKVKKSEIGDFFEKIADSLKNAELTLKDERSDEDKEPDKKEESLPEDDNFMYKPEDEIEQPADESSEEVEEDFFEAKPEIPEPQTETQEPNAAEKPPHRIQPTGAIKGFYPPGKMPTLEDYLQDSYGLPAMALSYRAHEIIPTGSPYSHLRQSLENAENYIVAGDLQTASDVYARTAGRIPNGEIREKIDKNIRDISQYLKELDERKREQPPLIVLPGGQPDAGKSGNEPENANLPQGAAEGAAPQAGGQLLTESVVQQIAQGFFDIQKANMDAGNIVINARAPIEGLSAGGDQGSGPTSLVLPTQNQDEDSAAENSDSAPLSMGSGGSADNAADEPARQDHKPQAEDASEPESSESVSEDSGEPEADEGGEPEAKEQAAEQSSESPDQSGSRSGDGQPGAGAPGVMEQSSVPSLEESEDLDSAANEDETPKESGPVQEIRGVLELKPPDQEDTPFLTLTYDFTRIPHEFYLARDHNVFEYAYYKYKPMLTKAHKFIRRKQITRALNYYRVIREQQIPREFRRMIDQNISDITEYLQKYLMARQG